MKDKDLLKVEKAEDEVSEFSYHSYGSAADFKTLQKQNGEENFRRTHELQLTLNK